MRPPGLAVVAVFYGLYHLMLVVFSARRQERIEASSRATVASVAAVGTDVSVFAIYAAWARGGVVLIAVRVRAELARYQITVAMFALTAAVGAAQFAYPGVVDALQRDPDRLRAGQWWRAVTSMFVQPSGLGQYAFNLLGIAVVGIAAQQICRPSHWLTGYLLGGLAGNLAMSLWFPHTLDGGSSDAVAALIGVVAVMAYSAQRPAWWPGYLYAAFFAAYLAGLATGGVVAGALAGNAAIVLVCVLRRATRPAVQVRVVLGLVLAAALLMTALRDSHGPGLLTGAVAGLLLARWRRSHDRMAVLEPARG